MGAFAYNRGMALKNPAKFWRVASQRKDWRQYILPDRTTKQFIAEGKAQAAALRTFYTKDDIILDYGCGIGRVLRYAAPAAKRAVGIDISREYLRRARQFVRADNVAFYQPGHYHGQVDFLYCLMVLQHNDAAHRQLIINEIKDLLRPGGRALLQLPRQESTYYREKEFVHVFSRQEVEDIGRQFKAFGIETGNLIDYASAYDKAVDHEYFLLINA